MYGSFHTEEIALTVNRLSFNETIASDNELSASGMGETVFFQTLLPRNTGDDEPGTSEAVSKLDIYNCKKSVLGNGESWMVYPKRLKINPFGQAASLVIKSNLSASQTFELFGNYRRLIMCTPAMGTIGPGEQIEIEVNILQTVLPTEQLMLGIYIENDKICVPIDVDKSNFPVHLR